MTTNERERAAETLHFEAFCLERQAAVELLMADTATSEESASWHLENRLLCSEMAAQARGKAARIMAEGMQERTGVCPSCGAAVTFRFCGEQRFPEHIAAKAGTPARFGLWTCEACRSTTSDMAIEKAGETCQ